MTRQREIQLSTLAGLRYTSMLGYIAEPSTASVVAVIKPTLCNRNFSDWQQISLWDCLRGVSISPPHHRSAIIHRAALKAEPSEQKNSLQTLSTLPPDQMLLAVKLIIQVACKPDGPHSNIALLVHQGSLRGFLQDCIPCRVTAWGSGYSCQKLVGARVCPGSCGVQAGEKLKIDINPGICDNNPNPKPTNQIIYTVREIRTWGYF